MLAQSFGDWEAICINDGSTDTSAEILSEYAEKDPRIKVIHQENAGLSAARNSGLDAAAGEYVLFLDSDDSLDETALQILSDRMKGEDLICFSGRRYEDVTGVYRKPDNLLEKSYPSGMANYNENALSKRDFAFVCVVLRAYKRSYLVDNQLRFKEGIRHEDNLFTPIACFFAKNVTVINECLYHYRLRPGSIMHGGTRIHAKDLMLVANSLAAFMTGKSGFDKTVVFRAITHHYQRAFVDSAPAEKNGLKHLCNWRLYGKVSRTKPRHRLNYLKNRYL